jgi:membrane protease subunit HflK
VLAEYQKAPQVTRERMYVDTMQQVFTNVSKVMIESRQGSNLLYLPLDKLMQATANGAPEPTAGGAMSTPALPTPPAAGAAGTDSRSRDASRTRERDGR